MATASISVMTLGPQQKAVASLVQPASAAATGASCVIVTTSPSAAAALGVAQQQQPQVLSPLLPKHALLVQQKRPIAAATSEVRAAAAAAAAAAQQADLLRCKRRINFASGNGAQPHAGAYHAHHHHHQPASVARRNARERNRVKQVNNGFATLRQHIPASVAAALSSPVSNSGSGRQASKKLSKVETLRMAVEYIRSLQQLLAEHDGVQPGQAPDTPASVSPYYASDDAASAAGHFTPSQMLGSSLSPPCSEAASSSGSPTPSFASEGSSYAASSTVYAGNGAADAYDGYEPMSPEDEELLDAISWWQQSQ